jgi:hypothetical protein
LVTPPRSRPALRVAAAVAVLLLASLPVRADEWKELRSAHFVVRYQAAQPPAGLLPFLEGLHAKLLLDLVHFAPWAQGGTVELRLYADAGRYRAETGMPPWAGGHVNPRERRIYAYPGPDFERTLAHEMAHLFFQDYFESKGAAPPVWLNEGVACLMEEDYLRARGLRVPDPDAWLPLADFLAFDYHEGAPAGPAVGAWYRQAASVTAFLMRRMTSIPFQAFCAALRDGKTVEQALPLAYGLQIPDVPALERVWLRGGLRPTAPAGSVAGERPASAPGGRE